MEREWAQQQQQGGGHPLCVPAELMSWEATAAAEEEEEEKGRREEGAAGGVGVHAWGLVGEEQGTARSCSA